MRPVLATLCLLGSTALNAEQRSVVLSVPGMNCPACPVTVMVAIKRVKGVKSVNADFESKLAEIIYDDEITDISSLQQAAKNVGFPSQVVDPTNQ